LWVIRFSPVANISGGFPTSGLISLGGPPMGRGGMIVGDPSCAVNTGSSPPEVTCAVLHLNPDTRKNDLWGIRFRSTDPHINSGFQFLGTPVDMNGFIHVISSDPSCASSPMQEVTCAVRTVSNDGNDLFGFRFDPASITNKFVQDLGVPQALTPLVGKLSCTRIFGSVAGSTDRTNCIVKGKDNGVFGVIFDPRSGIKSLITDILTTSLGPMLSDPSCAATPLPPPTATDSRNPGRFGICALRDGSNLLQSILGLPD